MRAVGVRELKNRLSEYLRLVRSGEEILALGAVMPPGSAAKLLYEERGER